MLACTQQAGRKRKLHAGFSDESFADTLQYVLKSDSGSSRGAVPTYKSMRRVYSLTDYQPIWEKGNYKPTPSASKLIDELEDIRWDGLDPERYKLSAIKQLKQKLDTTKKNTITDAIAFDTLLTHSYLAASKDLLIGYIPPKKADSLWFHANDSSWNAIALLADSTGGYHALSGFRSNVPTYTLLRDEYKHYTELRGDSGLKNEIARVHPAKHADSAELRNINAIIKKELPWVQVQSNDSVSDQAQLIEAYQFYRNIAVSGKLDSSTYAHLAMPVDTILQMLAANMERIRWMQQDFGNLYLLVDVPLMELYFRRDGQDAMHMRVVVGRPERQTPSIYAKMANVIINPAWEVPPTILKNDVLPGLQKTGRKYMKTKGLKAYDADGDVVDPSFINENNYRRYTYKQAPGDDNSLGYVKFNMPNHWDIYLHDTPHRDDFTKRNRFLSSGCIRLQQPKEMAIYILSDLEKRRYTLERLDSVIQTHKTRWEILKNKIPVHVAYLTAIEDTTGRHIRLARDIYQRDGKLISLLN